MTLALLGDDMALPATFSDARVLDPVVDDLRARVRVVPDASIGVHEATVVVRTRGAQEQRATAGFGLARSPSEDDALVAAKFHSLVEPRLGSRATAELEDAVRSRAPVRAITRLLRTALLTG